MARPDGFLQHPREVAPARAPAERTGDWAEVSGHLPVPALRRQAERCMDCGVPFCHTGISLGGATSGCPVNNLIPEWNDLVRRGRWREASERLHRTNNFPEFTSRVCPAPCEHACVLGLEGAPVTIKAIEHEIVDRAFAEGWIVPEPPSWRTGRRVAVVGSGPAGLAAASQLNRAGHAVTVFERADRIGGLLVYGIPGPKLDKRLVERRVGLLAEEGVRFVTSCEVGRDLTASELRGSFDGVVLATGATVARELPVPGRALAGVHLAMEYLTAAGRALLDGCPPAIPAAGRDVLVIGGGDTGTDCIATALRQGCRSLVNLELAPEPPADRAPANPWPQWARVRRVDYGHEEAIARLGADPRAFEAATEELLADAAGRVRAARVLVRASGERREIPADLVLLALGFTGPEPALPAGLGLALDPRGCLAAAEPSYRTSVDGVFAAGDCRRGASLVVWAIREGRGAARECDRHLMGSTALP